MFDYYTNKADVEKAVRILKSISSELEISYFEMRNDGKTVCNICVLIPEKGNKEKIKKLMSIGFKKKYRRKKEDINRWYMSTSYTMQVCLLASLHDVLKEV